MHSDNRSNSKNSRRDGQIHAPRGLASALADSEKGTQSSNTVRSTSIPVGSTTLLRASIDSLYTTNQGELSDFSESRLSNLKTLAQSPFETSSALAQIRLGKQLFEVAGNGRHPFAFILTNPHYRLEIGKQGSKFTPMVYGKIASALLSSVPTDYIISDLHQIIGELGSAQGATNINRADLCVDFMTTFPLESIEHDQWVTKARNFAAHVSDRQFSGFSIAAGADLSARLYNKTLEMKKNPRPYLEELWRDQRWDGTSVVWRLEFQFRRQALRDLSVVTYTDLMTSLRGLWEYATEKWLRHTIPSESDSTQSRWPLSPFWEAIQKADWQGERHLERVNLAHSRAPSDKTLFVNGLSPLTSFAAREGYVDAGEAVLAFFQAAQNFHNQEAFQKGVDFDNYFQTKVAQKRKAYGTGRNMPQGGGVHPDDKLVAREYRKRSDGDY
jgi:hypothetical protein